MDNLEVHSITEMRRIHHYDEIPPLSGEWSIRIAGLHIQANLIPGPSWLDYPATRRERAFWNGDTLEGGF